MDNTSKLGSTFKKKSGKKIPSKKESSKRNTLEVPLNALNGVNGLNALNGEDGQDEEVQNPPMNVLNINMNINKDNSRRLSQEEMDENLLQLIKIQKEEELQQSDENKEDPSPKLELGIKDTWGEEGTQMDDSTNEIMEDMGGLRLKYKLRENWLDNSSTFEKPFSTEVSAILPSERK